MFLCLLLLIRKLIGLVFFVLNLSVGVLVAVDVNLVEPFAGLFDLLVQPLLPAESVNQVLEQVSVPQVEGCLGHFVLDHL
jgi:hypothetical protein